MRWTTKKTYEIGEEKIVKCFAFLPKKIGHTTVWLEFYKKHYSFQKPHRWLLRKFSH